MPPATATLPTARPATPVHDIERNPLVGAQRLRDAVAIYGNHDSVSFDYAVAAFVEGRPAYWTTSCGNSQIAAGLVDSANLMSSLEAALATIPEHRKRGDKIEFYLSTLVPLNASAAQELSEAYARIGLWRDCDELEVRRVRDLGRAA